jgi:hypothetical protein
MRSLITVLAAALIVGACGAPPEEENKDKLGTDTDTSTDEDGSDDDEGDDEPVAYTWANQDAKEFEGTGDKVISSVSLAKGGASFELTHDGASNFIVHILDGAGEQVGSSLANEIGPATLKSVTAIPATAKYTIEVKADGAWTIETKAPKTVDEIPASLKGKGTYVSDVFPMKKASPKTVKLTHAGESNFIVRLLEARTGQLAVSSLANEIGPYSGESVLTPSADDHYLFEVIADGDWTLKVE